MDNRIIKQDECVAPLRRANQASIYAVRKSEVEPNDIVTGDRGTKLKGFNLHKFKLIPATNTINPPLFTASARPCKKDWFHRAGCAIDPTNPDRNGGRTQRLDPTNPNSPGGKVVRKIVPVACGVAGAVYSAPGVVSTVEGTVTAHKTCYKVIKYIQNR